MIDLTLIEVVLLIGMLAVGSAFIFAYWMLLNTPIITP